jgi:PAS domain S-box-containing protein
MKRFFRQLPLPAKLLLLVLFPLALVIFLSVQAYQERSATVDLLRGYIERINISSDISDLINSLQLERRQSYAFALKKDVDSRSQVQIQRPFTDLAIRKLQQSNDSVLKHFEQYSFLDKLADIRSQVDSGTSPEEVMGYYTTTIFRLNTLNISTPVYSNVYLKAVYSDLVCQKILSEMASYLGILRANIYNALYTRKNMQGILFFLIGVHDIYSSYEKEFLVKASPATLQQYNAARNNSELKQAIEYIDARFRTFSFDSTYTADQWWEMSGKGTDQLRSLQKNLMLKVQKEVNASYQREVRKKNSTLIFLVAALVMVSLVMFYTTIIINRMLRELNNAAQKIADGKTGVAIHSTSKDAIGGLAESISKIDKSNKQLAEAAEAIGKGNFQVSIEPRGKDDLLSSAIIRMKNNLQRFTHELEKSKQQFKQVADTAPVMIWMTDDDKQCNFVNKAWLMFTGRKLEQEMGYGWVEGMHPDDYSHSAEIFDDAFRQRKQYHVEYRFRNIEGEYKWLSEIGVPRYSTEGNFEGYIGTCIDIDEVKLHEQRRNEFIKMASHELKTPVTSVKGYVQLLLDMFKDQKAGNKSLSDESVQKALSTIDRQINKLTRLMSELLDLSRIDSGRLELNMLDFNLNEVVSETLQEMQHGNAHNILVRYDGEYVVHGDRDRISQVISNLLTNAIKYSPNATTVDVSLHQMDDQNVCVTVRDYGIGIDKKDQDKIFERFYRVQGWSEQTYPGFGIGLFIASQIIHRHQGTISVTSEKGKGSTFSVSLPIHEIITKGNENPALETKDDAV